MGNIRPFKRAVMNNSRRLIRKKRYIKKHILKTNSEGQKVRVRA